MHDSRNDLEAVMVRGGVMVRSENNNGGLYEQLTIHTIASKVVRRWNIKFVAATWKMFWREERWNIKFDAATWKMFWREILAGED